MFLSLKFFYSVYDLTDGKKLFEITHKCSMLTGVCRKRKVSNTGCPRKNAPLFWRAVAPMNFELGIKVRGDLECSGSQL